MPEVRENRAILNIHHVAYAVADISKASASFSALGYSDEGDCVHDNERGVLIKFLRHSSGLRIELVAPAKEDSPVTRILEKERGAAVPYHICYITEDADAEIAKLRELGFVQMGKKAPAPAIDGRNVVFAFSSYTGLIELVELEEA